MLNFNADSIFASEISFHRVTDCLRHVDIAHPDVLAACESDEEKDRLVCVWLRMKPIYSRFFSIEIEEGDDENVKRFLSILRENRQHYDLRIWFIAPYDLDDFEEQCLVFLLLYMEITHSFPYGIDTA